MKADTFRRLCVFMTAVLCGITPALHVRSFTDTASALESTGTRGDVDQDGAVSSADAEALAKHLTTAAVLQDQTAAVRADINGDGRINAADLTLLKRGLLAHAPGSGTDLIAKPLSVLSPTLPSVGSVRVLVVLVSFPDCAHPDTMTPEKVQAGCFGAADAESRMCPMESISAFYQRASYGRLKMDGDVYAYTAQQNLQSYAGNTDKLTDETLAGLDEQIDYTRYDSDKDGLLDAVIIAVPGKASSSDWRPRTGLHGSKQVYDGLRIGSRCIGRGDPSDRTGFNSVWTHELGHAMGLPDYYKYFNTQDGYYGMYGDAGWELMDDSAGDLSAFSKLMLGWYTQAEIQVYTGGTQTFRLSSSQSKPGCVIIPRDPQAGWCSEYFVLEYQTNEGNNQAFFKDRHIYQLFTEGGLRVLHCDATVCDGVRGPELKWNNYGKYYDSTNTKQRVLRLVNEKEGGAFFCAGDTVSDSVSGFRWYDDDGGQTVSAGCTVKVQSIADGVCTFTVSG